MISVGIAFIGLAIFTVFDLTSIIVYRPHNWWMAPELNAGDVAFGLRSDHPHPAFGDTVIYFAPMKPGYEFVGRVAGVPGDAIVIDDGKLFRNETEVPFFHGRLPLYQLQVAGAGVLLGNQYLVGGDWPTADRWSAPNRIPDDCYLILANDTAAYDSHSFGLVPGSLTGPCASTRFPWARIVTRVINSWPTGMSYEAYVRRRAALR